VIEAFKEASGTRQGGGIFVNITEDKSSEGRCRGR
jgi:hypothetical protein